MFEKPPPGLRSQLHPSTQARETYSLSDVIAHKVVFLEILLCENLTCNKYEGLAFYGHELTCSGAGFACLMVQPFV